MNYKVIKKMSYIIIQNLLLLMHKFTRIYQGLPCSKTSSMSVLRVRAETHAQDISVAESEENIVTSNKK